MTREQFRATRKELGHTQESLAQTLDVSFHTVQLWERKGPSRLGRILIKQAKPREES